MFLHNSAQPEWMNILCDVKLLSEVFCTQTNFNQERDDTFNQNNAGRVTCTLSDLMFDHKCLSFVLGMKIKDQILGQSSNLLRTKRILSVPEVGRIVHHFFHPTKSGPSLLFAKDTADKIFGIKCVKELNLMLCGDPFPIRENEERLIFLKSSLIQLLLGENLFKCVQGSYVLSLLRCDRNIDCPNDNSDEEGCVFQSRSDLYFPLFGSGSYYNNSGCSWLFYRTFDGKCIQYGWSEQQQCSSQTSTEVLNCSGDKVKKMVENDLVVDCVSGRYQDELHLIELLSIDVQFSCSYPGEVPCRQGHSKCFNISDVCIYSLNVLNHLIPCRNGGHLEDCLNFECNQKFKCLLSYCVPWNFVCNGKWDCPQGDDEIFAPFCQSSTSCKNMYKCRKMLHTCLPIGCVCDGRYDCIMRDDEELCTLHNVVCPTECSCLGYAMRCFNATLNTNSYPFRFLFFICVTIPPLNYVFPKYQMMRYVIATQNDIEVICHLNLPRNLSLLDVSFNKICHIKNKCIVSHSMLKFISLASNHITYFVAQALVNLTNLVYVSLSNNPAANFPKQMIQNSSLKLFSITDITFKLIDKLSFQDLHSRIIRVTDFQICCVVPSSSKCTAKLPWFYCCSDLLPDKSVKIVFPIVSSTIVLNNVISIIIHAVTWSSQKTFCTTIICINVSDLLCATFLKILYISDISLSEIFMVRDNWWRSGFRCFFLCYLPFGSLA